MKSILPLLPLDAGLSRRALFRYGFLTTAAMLLGEKPGFALPAAAAPRAKAEAVIQIWLWRPLPHRYVRPEAGSGERLLRPAQRSDRDQCRRDPYQ